MRVVFGALGHGVRLSIVVLAANLATLGVLAWGGRLQPELDAISHFAPLLAIGAAGALVLSIVSRSIYGIILAAIGLIAPAGLMAPEYLALWQAPKVEIAADAPKLKLISINLWVENQHRDAAIRFIRAENPDIVVIEEAYGDWRPLIEDLAKDYPIAARCGPDPWCTTLILSRFPLAEDLSPDTYTLTTARLQAPERLGGGTIDVMGVHLHWPLPSRRQAGQVEEIVEAAQDMNQPRAFIAGDFNSTPWSQGLRGLDGRLQMQRRTHALFSWPSQQVGFTSQNWKLPGPILPIDQIYAGADWTLVSIRRGPDVGSDHYPLIAEFTPARAAPAQPVAVTSPAPR